MTQLIIYSADSPANILLDTQDFDTISRELAASGAKIERWTAEQPLAPGATSGAKRGCLYQKDS